MSMLNVIMPRKHRLLAACLSLCFLLVGCAQNPVTQKKEMHLVKQSQEIKIGQTHYLPAQQMGGGKFITDPELTAYVQQVGSKLAKVSDRRDLPFEFVVLNDSTPNAWALPGGKIAVNRGLLVHLKSEAELAAVLGHEITHATARHGAKAMERQMAMAAGLGVLSAVVAINSDNQSTQDLAMTGAALTAGLLTHKYGRDAEREADHFGIDYMVKAGYDPKAAVQLQETFVRLMDKKDSNWLNGLFASHPPSQERAKANAVYAATFPQRNLMMGAETYQQKTADLIKTKPAYDAHDEAKLKLSKKHYKDALTLTERAIQLQPKEALFYALKGDIFAAQKQHQEAVKWYTQAIERDASYYAHFLKRGLSNEQLKNYAQSKQDLKQSQQLLPTESAQNALNRIGIKQIFS